MTPPRPGLANLLEAKSVALVGLSARSFWSQRLMQNSTGFGFTGPVHVVNPSQDEVLGHPSHPSVQAIGEKVDLAYVLTSAHRLPDVVEDLGAAGVQAAVVLAGGFAEAGESGARLQERVASRCTELGIALLGPNCLGFVDYVSGLAPFGDRIAPPMDPDGIAVVSQSGALLQLIHRAAQRRAVGLSHLFSVGNEAMFTVVDVIEELLERDEVRVIAAYLEGIRDAPGFVRVAERALELGKPIVAIKVGASDIAAVASMAHTGALTGDDRIINAVFERYAVTRVGTPEALIETSAMLATTRLPAGSRTAVMSTSGGACGIAADLAHGTKLDLAPLSERTRAALAAVRPEFATAQNPLDTTGVIVDDADLLRAGTQAMASGGDYDLLVLNLDLPPADGDHPDDIHARMQVICDAVQSLPVPTLLATTISADAPVQRLKFLHDRGLHVGDGLAATLRAADRLVGYAANRSRALERRRALSRREPAAPRLALDGPVIGALSEVESARLLRRLGVPMVPGELATSVESAVALAAEIDGPVVLKLVSATIPHKSDIGGVEVGISGATEVAAAYERLVGLPGAEGHVVDGVLVARELHAVAELIAGIVVDPAWGPAVVVGSGGVFAEVLDDTAVAMAPVDEEQARRMVEGLRGSALLAGERGRAAADLDEVARFLSLLSHAAGRLPERVVAVDINPVLACPTQALGADALVVTGPPDRDPQPKGMEG